MRARTHPDPTPSRFWKRAWIGCVSSYGGKHDTDPTARSSAKSVGSKAKLAGLTGNVTGGVKSKKRQCEKLRLASLIHVTFGGLEFVDTEKTTKKGKFGLEGAVPGQTYIVGVGKKTVTKLRFGKPPKKLLCTQTESDPFVP